MPGLFLGYSPFASIHFRRETIHLFTSLLPLVASAPSVQAASSASSRLPMPRSPWGRTALQGPVSAPRLHPASSLFCAYACTRGRNAARTVPSPLSSSVLPVRLVPVPLSDFLSGPRPCGWCKCSPDEGNRNDEVCVVVMRPSGGGVRQACLRTKPIHRWPPKPSSPARARRGIRRSFLRRRPSESRRRRR